MRVELFFIWNNSSYSEMSDFGFISDRSNSLALNGADWNYKGEKLPNDLTSRFTRLFCSFSRAFQMKKNKYKNPFWVCNVKYHLKSALLYEKIHIRQGVTSYQIHLFFFSIYLTKHRAYLLNFNVPLSWVPCFLTPFVRLALAKLRFYEHDGFSSTPNQNHIIRKMFMEKHGFRRVASTTTTTTTRNQATDRITKSK